MWPGISIALAKGVGVGTVEFVTVLLCCIEEENRWEGLGSQDAETQVHNWQVEKLIGIT